MRSVGVLAAGFAHEIKNPLTTVKTFIDYLEENYDKKEYRDKFRHLVSAEIDNIRQIADRIMDFAKPKSVAAEELDLHQIIDDILSFLGENLIRNDIMLTKQYSDNTPALKADRVQLSQVFLNLFLNAIDAMPNGGSLTVKTKSGDDFVSIHIIDTGVGIPEEEMPRLFSPFYSRKEHGTGLGLAISKSIIEELSGAISVTSQKDVGTTFTVKLPVSTRGVARK